MDIKKICLEIKMYEVYLRTGEGQLISDNQPKKEKTDMEKAIEAIQSSNQITLKAQEHTDRLLALLERHFNRLERDNA